MSEEFSTYDFVDLMEAVRSKITPMEREDDVVTMIDLLAWYRAVARREEIAKSHFEFASALLCFIFEGLKRPYYASAAVTWRQSFVGISRSARLKAEFFWSINPNVHNADNPGTVVSTPFEAAFTPRSLVSKVVPAPSPAESY